MKADAYRIGRSGSGPSRAALAAADSKAGTIAMIPCTVRQLEVFLAAAEDCHFACTASRLGISQAAVSTHIAALEHQFGRPLFTRKRGRKPVLSRDGLYLLSEARSFLTRSDKTHRQRAVDAGTPDEDATRRTIHVGAGGHLLDDYIKHRLPAFHKAHADLDIQLHYINSPGQCAQLVKDRSVDLLAYTVANPACFPLRSTTLGTVRFGLYVGTRFRSRVHESPAALSSLPFILPPKGSAACGLVQSALRTAGIHCEHVAAHVQFATVAKDLAKEGQGAVALFETMIGADDDEALFKLDVELPTMYRTLFRADGRHDDAVHTVELFLRDTLAC